MTLDSPGTTRDAVDSIFEHEGKTYVLVDTAGIRRKSRVPLKGPERLAVSSAVKAIQRCHVVVLLVDAEAGVEPGPVDHQLKHHDAEEPHHSARAETPPDVP